MNYQRVRQSLRLLGIGTALTLTSVTPASASMFGEENIALMKLVVGQIAELDQLAETLEVSKEQRAYLEAANRGINRVINQIETIQEIATRTQGLNPTSVRSLSDLNRELSEMKTIATQTQQVLEWKLSLVDVTVSQAALQSETAYLMGQEMVGTGRLLAEESRSASPGRAAQISASAQSAQMLAEGVQLQSFAHLIQIQAQSLELQRALMAHQLGVGRAQESIFTQSLEKSSPRGRRAPR